MPRVATELKLILEECKRTNFGRTSLVPRLETVRRRLRGLIKLIEAKQRPLVFTDFEDEIGASSEIEIRGVTVGTDMDRFRAKARHFLKDNVNRLAVMKLRRNEPLTPTDLDELERIFVGAGAEPAQMEAIRAGGGLLGVLCALAGWIGSRSREESLRRFPCGAEADGGPDRVRQHDRRPSHCNTA